MYGGSGISPASFNTSSLGPPEATRTPRRPPAAGPGPQQQQFSRAARAGAAAAQPRGDHPGIVDHEHVAGPEVVADLAEDAMLDAAGGALDDQQSRRVARRGGLVGGQFRRERGAEAGPPPQGRG